MVSISQSGVFLSIRSTAATRSIRPLSLTATRTPGVFARYPSDTMGKKDMLASFPKGAEVFQLGYTLKIMRSLE